MVETRRINQTFVHTSGHLFVFLFLCFLTIWKLDSIPFHGDESSWISSSESFEAFISFDYSNPVWQESYWTLTQPPVARYFIGIGRNLAGYSIGELNNPYDYFLTEAENIAQNTIPNDQLLWWSRLPMAILMAASFFLIFLGVTRCYGVKIGILTLAIFILNPYPFNVLRLALGESPLLFFSLLAILFANQFLQTEPENKVLFWLWLILLCISCGLAAASKLNGGATMIGVLIIVFIKLRRDHIFGKSLPITLLILFGSGLLSFGIFVIVNPFLYPAPLKNALSMLMFRSYEIGLQVELYPDYHISGLWQQIQTVVLRVFQQHAVINFNGAWIINAALFILGIYLITKNRASTQTNLLISFASIATALVVPSLFTPLDYPRYFLFPTIFSQIIISFTIAFILFFIVDSIQTKLQTNNKKIT